MTMPGNITPKYWRRPGNKSIILANIPLLGQDFLMGFPTQYLFQGGSHA